MKNKILNKIITMASASYKIVIAFIAVALVLFVIFVINIAGKKYNNSTITVAKTTQMESYLSIEKNEEIEKNKEEISREEIIKNNIENLKNIIELNSNDVITEQLSTEEIDIEFNTKYQESNLIASGTMQVLQEGIDGTQIVTKKKKYLNGKIQSEEIAGTQLVKAAVNKIVQIGTGENYLKYTANIGDKMYVTSTTLAIRNEASNDSKKIITINKNEEVTLEEKLGDWYRVKYQSYNGWVQSNCLTKENQNNVASTNDTTYTKSQLLKTLSFNMKLNKKSGLSLSQFEKILNDSKDTKNVLKENAKYFYYAEQQYNLNGVFLASVAIHESAWGTSAMAQNKKNLFGYGAYDSDPSNNAYVFSTYSEGIDLLARVFVKYYINPKGTQIYGGELAEASHYNGSNISGVNKKYATDKNWGNSVYKWMEYLYNKL